MFDGSYIEGRFGIVMEEVRDALASTSCQIERVADALEKLAGCVDEKGRMQTIEKKEYKKYD